MVGEQGDGLGPGFARREAGGVGYRGGCGEDFGGGSKVGRVGEGPAFKSGSDTLDYKGQ